MTGGQGWGAFRHDYDLVAVPGYLDQTVKTTVQPTMVYMLQVHQTCIENSKDLSHIHKTKKKIASLVAIMIHTKPQAIPGPVDP